MMKKVTACLLFCLIALFVFSSAQAKGTKSSVYVLTDLGITEETTEAQIKQLNQVDQYLKNDLVRRLKKAKFSPNVIQASDEYVSGPGNFLLTIKIVKFKSGSKAARMFVGFGAGSASLETHADFVGENNQVYLSEDFGVGSSRDWRNIIVKINKLTVKAVRASLK